MTASHGLIGNGELLARVRADGLLAEAYYPSIGYFRHLLQSQFGLRDSQTGRFVWLTRPDFEPEQTYIADTNVLQTSYNSPGLEATVTDLASPSGSSILRILDVYNVGSEPLTLELVHGEAASIADHKGEFGYNVVYYSRLDQHFVRYRGHPWDEAVESQIVWIIGARPQPETYQCGVSYCEQGDGIDAFYDVLDGKLQENRYAFGDPTGVTSAFLWRRTLAPGESTSVSVSLTAGMSLFEAEDAAKQFQERRPDQRLGETVSHWRDWISTGRQRLPPLGEERLERLYLRSILLLKLLQDRRFGSFIAAPTLEPDYRYCWPRDGVFEAWALDRCGYSEEAHRFYRWCRRTQMHEGLWYQNHYTDGRRHWAGIQVDQVATVVWGVWQHFELNHDREFLVEMWPMVQRASDYLLRARSADSGLVFSEQDLWEETGGELLYTNAATVAGLECAALHAKELGQERHAARWRKEAGLVRKAIEAHLRRDGYYVGEREAESSYPVRKDYLHDIANLAMVVPFRLVAPGGAPMRNTAKRIEQSMKYAAGGIGRYASDLFMGGNPWSLSALWLALFHVETGDLAECYRLLYWCLKHATLHDFMPEQSQKQTGAPAGASPLGWSHAWVIILLQRIGRRLTTEGESPPAKDPRPAPTGGRPAVGP